MANPLRTLHRALHYALNPPVRPARDRPPLWPWLVALVAANLADLAATMLALARGLGHEANPAAATLYQDYGVAGLVTLKVVLIGAALVVAAALHRLWPRVAVAVVALLTLGTVIVGAGSALRLLPHR